MLVMATLYQTVNDDLPTTSSLKMIDLWMLFSLAMPFMEVILHTAMAWIRQKYETENTKQVIDITGGNQTEREARILTARSESNVVKRLIKEAVTAATKDDQDKPQDTKIVTKEPMRPIIVWDQKDEGTWPKRVLRYFFYHPGFCIEFARICQIIVFSGKYLIVGIIFLYHCCLKIYMI